MIKTCYAEIDGQLLLQPRYSPNMSSIKNSQDNLNIEKQNKPITRKLEVATLIFCVDQGFVQSFDHW